MIRVKKRIQVKNVITIKIGGYMSIFSVFILLGGLAFFLYGMNVMSMGLEKIAGGKLEAVLKGMTDNLFKSLALGAGITIAIQSSSAMTVMLVGFVNSGIMQLYQTVGVIMGSNIGTTLTTWILGLTGIETDNLILRLMMPESFTPVLALVGILLIMTQKQSRRKEIGNILVGFSVLMTGMAMMSDSISPLAENPEFAKVLIAFKNPLIGVLVGAIFTGIIQSSAASVGALQALSLTGSITYNMAIPIIMGQNIGTCVTALISSIGVSKNAKRVAIIHISFNIIGTIVWLVLYLGVQLFIDIPFCNDRILPLGIAACHSVFNIATTILLIPFSRKLESIARFVIKETEIETEDEVGCFLDERLMATPMIAVCECKQKIIDMVEKVNTSLITAIHLIEQYDEKKVQFIEKNEKIIDEYEDMLGTYLVKLGNRPVTEETGKEISALLHMLIDIERIGDHAYNIREIAENYHSKKLEFSLMARKELSIMTEAINELMNMMIKVCKNNDMHSAKKIEPLEQVIDSLKDELRTRHIERLRKGSCNIEQGLAFLDIVQNYERISDHCSNIAVCMIKMQEGSFETHEYLQHIREEEESFKYEYSWYQKKYALELIKN